MLSLNYFHHKKIPPQLQGLYSKMPKEIPEITDSTKSHNTLSLIILCTDQVP